MPEPSSGRLARLAPLRPAQASRGGWCPRRAWDTAREGQPGALPGARPCAGGVAHYRHPVIRAGIVLCGGFRVPLSRPRCAASGSGGPLGRQELAPPLDAIDARTVPAQMVSNLHPMGTVLSKAREEHDNSDDSTILESAWLSS